MSRYDSAINEAEAIKFHIELRLFIDADFASGPVRLVSGPEGFSFGGNDYVGAGEFQAMDDIIETLELQPHDLNIQLSGVDSTLLHYLRTEKYHNRSLSIYYGWLNAEMQLVDTPELFYEGRMDVLSGHIPFAPDEDASVGLSVTHRLNIWSRPGVWQYTQEHQNYLMGSGDNFFDKVSLNVNRVLKWGDGTIPWSQDTPAYFNPGFIG